MFNTAARQSPSRSAAEQAARIIGQKLRPRRRMTEHEVDLLAQHARGPFKMTMPAPSYILARGYRPA